MPDEKPTYTESLALLHEYVQNPRLLEHAYSVEGAMRYLAGKAGEDEEKWGIIGLVHDLNAEVILKRFSRDARERFAEQGWTENYIRAVDSRTARDLLTERGWPEEYMRAIDSHDWEILTDVEPLTRLEKTLYTVDKLAWIISRMAFKDPEKGINGLSAEDVIEQWEEDESISPPRHRAVIERGVDMLGVDFRELANDIILALRQISDRLGL